MCERREAERRWSKDVGRVLTKLDELCTDVYEAVLSLQGTERDGGIRVERVLALMTATEDRSVAEAVDALVYNGLLYLTSDDETFAAVPLE
ncbi:hypothetical protein PtrSN002B_012188 [Pyrenophora tritici-repentis]|nr:hypothetical protein PtrSN002B_012188 [Pyrenophora tritici-repentis]